jgi:hypothetical protein
MLTRLFRTSILLLFVTACGQLVEPLPTLAVLNTATASPPLATIAVAPPLPSATPSSTPQIESPTAFSEEPSQTPLPVVTLPPLPTLSMPTSIPTAIPQPAAGSSAIQFNSPGPLSRVLSPIELYGYAIPGYNSIGRVELYGEDGRLIASQTLALYTAYTWAYFYGTLPFTTGGVGELARLSLSTRDQYGRLKALTAVHLLLQTQGLKIINPPGNLKERCVLNAPSSTQRISGGRVYVNGVMRPYNSLPLAIELVNRAGVVVGSQLAVVAPAPDDSYVSFQASVPYSITSGSFALLVVRQSDERIPGIIYLYSREIYLNP